MRVADFMTRRVITVTPDTSILAAAQLMLERKISGLPVVDAADHLVGIVSEHDLLRDDGKGIDGSPWLQLIVEPPGLAQETARLRDRKVAEVMTSNPVTVTAATSLAEASRLLEQHIKRLPVVQNGRLVGIIARADLVRALAQSIEGTTTAARPDASVRARMLELEQQLWRNRARTSKPF
jgi:CBS domain-containing protein